ncbi:MAG: hypothetical protein N4A40_08285 [Tissierellales bacterium]|jgi:hypothetical protein|nr:hypothetical protein [Tissierellales bacterium]
MKSRIKKITAIAIILIVISTIMVILESNNEKFVLEEYKLYEKDYLGRKTILIENVLDFKYADLKGIGETLLVIETDRPNQIYEGLEVGNWIRFYEYKEGKVKLVYENDFTRVRPWMIDVGHIDDDDRDDVFVGVYKNTKVYPLAKRPFFFNWDGKKLTRKWTGSYFNINELMNVEFEDEDKDGIDEVKARERLKNGREVTNFYKWAHFNFVIKE